MALQLSPRLRDIQSPIDIGFFIGAIALIVVGWVSHRGTTRLHEEAALVQHTYEVLRVLDRLETDLDHPPSDTVLIRIADELARMRMLTGDNTVQQSRLDTLRTALDNPIREPARALIRRMEAAEQQLLSERQFTTNQSARRATTIIVFSTVLAVLLMAIALALLHDDLQRRRTAELALQASEVKYRQLVEQAADAILIVDSNAICVEGNARAAQVLGRSQAEIPGLPLGSFVKSETGGPVLPMLRYGHVTTGEFWVTRPNNTRVAVEVRATMLEDGRVQVIARDVSERKEVERVKDEFVSVVSHELRTPLTSIRGALGLLAAGRLDDAPDKRRRMLDLAAANTDRLIRLINDILDIERMRSGGLTFDRTELSAAELVTNAVEAMRPIADRERVALHADVDDLHIFADPDRMTQTLTNLIDNAIKFSPSDSSIDICVRRDGRFAMFEVRDRGRGIPAAMRDSVFNRFQQVDNSDSRDKGGTGLGLAICRSIVEQHGGRIWIESEVGQGSSFRFTIPLFRAERNAGGDSDRPSILVCDGDTDLVDVVRTTLAARGYQAAGMSRAREAMEQFDESRADLLVCDIALPDISGLRLLRHVHSAAPETAIVVYTALYLDQEERDFIKNVGGVIVTKARTSPEQLADEVDRLMTERAQASAAASTLSPDHQPG
ncbi:MAG TPA: ATP-binding protein [Gemmatimonadaceae bacterium]|jgi:PAS domain S-box-containing protein